MIKHHWRISIISRDVTSFQRNDTSVLPTYSSPLHNDFGSMKNVVSRNSRCFPQPIAARVSGRLTTTAFTTWVSCPVDNIPDKSFASLKLEKMGQPFHHHFVGLSYITIVTCYSSLVVFFPGLVRHHCGRPLFHETAKVCKKNVSCMDGQNVRCFWSFVEALPILTRSSRLCRLVQET